MYQYLTGIFILRGLAASSWLAGLRYLLVLLIVISTSFKIQAQDFFPEQTNYAISIGADVELPGKNMGNYKSTLGYNIGFMQLLDHITIGVNLSYREFSPKTAVTITRISAGSQATTTIANYTALLMYMSGTYNVPLTDRLSAYGGLNIGFGYNTSSIHYADANSNVYLGGTCKQAYAAPKFGIGFAVNNTMGIDAHAGYNVFVQSGNVSNDASSGYTGVAPTGYTSIMTGVDLVFKF